MLLEEPKLTWAMRRVRIGADPATRVPVGQVRRRVMQLEEVGMTRGPRLRPGVRVSAARGGTLLHEQA